MSTEGVLLFGSAAAAKTTTDVHVRLAAFYTDTLTAEDIFESSEVEDIPRCPILHLPPSHRVPSTCPPTARPPSSHPIYLQG